MQRTRLLALLLGLALFGSVTAQYGDDDAYGGDEDGGYGGGGDEEPPEEDEGGPPAAGMTEELTSVEAFEAFIDNEDASVIGAFTAKEMADPAAVKPEGWDDEEDGEFEPEMITNPALAAFNQASSGLYNFRFAHTTDPDVLARLKSKAGGVYMYRSPKFSNKEAGDRPRERFPSETYVEATLGNWLKSKAQPLVGKWSYQTKERYDKAKAVVIVFFNLDFEKNAKGVNYVLKRARKVAAALQAKGVAVALGSTSDLSYEMEDFGLEVKSKASDMLMGIKAGEQFYGSSEAFSGPALQAFAEKFLAGELEPYVKPPPPPYEPPADDDDDYNEDGEGEDGEDYGGEDEEKEEM